MRYRCACTCTKYLIYIMQFYCQKHLGNRVTTLCRYSRPGNGPTSHWHRSQRYRLCGTEGPPQHSICTEDHFLYCSYLFIIFRIYISEIFSGMNPESESTWSTSRSMWPVYPEQSVPKATACGRELHFMMSRETQRTQPENCLRSIKPNCVIIAVEKASFPLWGNELNNARRSLIET